MSDKIDWNTLIVTDDRIEAKLPAPVKDDRPEIDLSTLYIQPGPQGITPVKDERGIVRRFFGTVGGKVAMGVAGTIIGNAIIHSPTAWWLVTSGCAVVGSLGGEGADKTRKKFGDLLDKIDKPDAPATERKPNIIERAKEAVKEKVEGGAVEVVQEKAQDFKEDASQKANDVVVKPVQKAADKVEVAVGGIGTALGNTAKGVAAGTTTAIAKLPAPAPIQLPKPRYNAACPYCWLPMNLTERAVKTRSCPSCFGSFHPNAARAMAMRGFGR